MISLMALGVSGLPAASPNPIRVTPPMVSRIHIPPSLNSGVPAAVNAIGRQFQPAGVSTSFSRIVIPAWPT